MLASAETEICIYVWQCYGATGVYGNAGRIVVVLCFEQLVALSGDLFYDLVSMQFIFYLVFCGAMAVRPA